MLILKIPSIVTTMATDLERIVRPYTVRTLVVRVVDDQSTNQQSHPHNLPVYLACLLLPLVTYLAVAAVMTHGLTGGAPQPVD